MLEIYFCSAKIINEFLEKLQKWNIAVTEFGIAVSASNPKTRAARNVQYPSG